MKKMTLFLISMIALAACQKNQESLDPQPEAQAYGEWQDKTQKSRDGSVIYTESRRAVAQDELKRVYSTTDLQPIPVDPYHNAQVFAIKNVPEYEDALFIAPKIYAYGSQDGVRLVPRKEGSKLILPFPVVLLDGVQTLVQDSRAGKDIQVPGQFLVKDLDGLKKNLNSRYQKNVLASLPGCPRQVLVRVPGKTFDVTPELMKLSDYCQINTPFNVEIVVDHLEAEYLLKNAIAEGNVEIAAIYETKVSFAVARMSLSYDKSRIFSELQMALAGSNGYIKADIQVKITELLKKLNMHMSIKGDYTEQMQMIADNIFAMFFEPMPEVERLKVPKCKDAAICFSLAIQKDKYQEELRVEWEQSTNIMTGETIAIASKLRPTQDTIIQIGDPSSNGVSHKRLSLSNRSGAMETGMTVISGDQLEVEPHFLEVQDQSYQSIFTERRDNKVCTAESSRAKRDGPEKTYCSAWENRWTQVTTYNFPAKNSFQRYDNPMGQFAQVFDGLYLVFTFKEETSEGPKDRQIECPLSLFHRHGDGRSLKVILENRPTCEIFGKNKTNPLMFFRNGIQFPMNYKEGVETLDWQGNQSSNVQVKSFMPEIKFGGVLKLRGLGFISE